MCCATGGPRWPTLAPADQPPRLVQFPHVFFAGMTTAGFFVLGISAYHLLKKSRTSEVFRRSFQYGRGLCPHRLGPGRPGRATPRPSTWSRPSR